MSKNLGKIQKLSLNFFFLGFFFAETKCYLLSFQILGGHYSTRALQSSPVTFFSSKILNILKIYIKKNAILLVLPMEEISL